MQMRQAQAQLKEFTRKYSTKANIRDFTPLKPCVLSQLETVMCSTNIISMDVETMRSSLGDVQIPILISIAYRVNTGEIKALKFMIDNNVIQHKGVKFACNLLWSELFNFISENISPKSVIFSHNLGGFDGFFLFQGLLNNLDRKNIHTIIDKDNNFIQITATIKGNKYV